MARLAFLSGLCDLGHVSVLLLPPARAAGAVAGAHQISHVYVALLRVHKIVASLARLAIWIRLDGLRQRLLEGRCFGRFFVDHPFHFRFPHPVIPV